MFEQFLFKKRILYPKYEQFFGTTHTNENKFPERRQLEYEFENVLDKTCNEEKENILRSLTEKQNQYFLGKCGKHSI